MKYTLVISFAIVFPALTLAQSSPVFSGKFYDLFIDSSDTHIVLFSRDKNDMPDKTDTVFYRISNPGRVTQIACNDSIVSFIDSNSLGYSWHVFQRIKDPDEARFYIMRRMKHDSLQRTSATIAGNGYTAHYYKALQDRSWKVINSEFVGVHEMHSYLSVSSSGSSTSRLVLVQVQLEDPFTLKKRLKKIAAAGDTFIERVYNIDPSGFGSILTHEYEIE